MNKSLAIKIKELKQQIASLAKKTNAE